MPSSVVKSIAGKAGKSVATVEKDWEHIREGLKKNMSEDNPNFYGTVVNMLKKKYGIAESSDNFKKFSNLLMVEKDEEDDKKDKKSDSSTKAADFDGDGDTDMVDLLREVIDTIKSAGDEHDAGEEGELDFGLQIIYDVAEELPEETVENIIDALLDYYGFDVDDVEGDDDDDEEDDKKSDKEKKQEEALIARLQDDIILAEADTYFEELISEGTQMATAKTKRLKFIKKKRKGQLGNRVNTMSFKRNYKFDFKKKKFVKRDKAMSTTDLRKKSRVLKRVVRKASTKIHAKRTKKRLAHVKDPYSKNKA